MQPFVLCSVNVWFNSRERHCRRRESACEVGFGLAWVTDLHLPKPHTPPPLPPMRRKQNRFWKCPEIEAPALCKRARPKLKKLNSRKRKVRLYMRLVQVQCIFLHLPSWKELPVEQDFLEQKQAHPDLPSVWASAVPTKPLSKTKWAHRASCTTTCIKSPKKCRTNKCGLWVRSPRSLIWLRGSTTSAGNGVEEEEKMHHPPTHKCG